jgi:hypothetical protein
LIVLVVVAVLAGPALAVTVDFDAAEGYAPGQLFGQPGSGSAWTGDDTPKIQVSAAQSQAGGQSVLIDPDATTGNVDDWLFVGNVPSRFSLQFYWRPSGSGQGNAVVYLKELDGPATTRVGPRVVFTESDSRYQIKYIENGFVGNIKLGLMPAFYENQWSQVEIVGDLATHTFDFYLNGTLEATGVPFGSTLPSNLATGLHYLGLQASTSGTTNHFFDSIRIDASPAAPVPTLSGWAWLLLLGLLIGSSLWLTRRRGTTAAGPVSGAPS